MDVGQVLQQGWLYKQSRYMKQWRKRWVVLTKEQLSTYNTDNASEKPTESLPLKFCRGVKSAEDETKKEFSFRVECGQQVFYFHADDQQTKERWIGVISKTLHKRIGKSMISPKIIANSSDEEKNDDDSSDD